MYTESPKTAYVLLNYILQNRLDKYFRNNFQLLNKLLFISEKIIH